MKLFTLFSHGTFNLIIGIPELSLKGIFELADLIPEMKDGQMLFVLGDVAELPLGVDSADHTVNEACILDGGVAYKWVYQKIQQT